jgi:hypothetical protein
MGISRNSFNREWTGNIVKCLLILGIFKYCWERNNVHTYLDKTQFTGFEVVIVVGGKSTVVCVLMPYSSIEVRLFGGTYRLHFQGRKQPKQEASNKKMVCSNLDLMYAIRELRDSQGQRDRCL